MLNIQSLIDDTKCYEEIRKLRWPEGVRCPHCDFHWTAKKGYHSTQVGRRRYRCHSCERSFDDLTGTPLSGHHQPVKVWLLCLYFMGLNQSNHQIGVELGLNKDDVQYMCSFLRQYIHDNQAEVVLEGEVEFDEVYVIAGHKGNSASVQTKGRKARRNRLKGKRGRGTLEAEKPPIFGMIQRDGQLVIQMLPNVQQQTIHPLILETVAPGTLIYTDEYNIYSRLESLGYQHKSVNHSTREYARDDDGDGFHEVHVNTIEGVWSLLRSWLRPHRGLSQEKLPIYLSFFEFVHNARKRGRALFDSLLKAVLQPAAA